MHDRIAEIAPGALLDQLVPHTPYFVWMADPDEGVSYVSDQFERLWGVEPDALEGDLGRFIEGVHPDDREDVRDALERVMAGEVVELEYRVNPGEDYRRVVTSISFPFTDDDGDAVAAAGIVREVTDVDADDRELRLYKLAIEGSIDLIAAVDRDDRYLFANEAYCRYHGVDQDEIAGRGRREVLPDDTFDATLEHTDRALAGEVVEYQMTREHPNRGRRWFDVYYYPMRAGDEIVGVVGVLRDVTEHKERTTQLQVVDRVLRHNIRNELTVIGGLAQDIAEATEGPAHEAAIEVAAHADKLTVSTSKSRIITKALTDYQLLYTVDIAELARTLVDRFGDRPADLDITVDAPEEATVLALDHFDAAFTELVDNAITHNPFEEPVVRIGVEVTDERVVLTVADNGPGIPDSDARILEAGEPYEPLEHGSGLGCWLVHWIVRRSNGELTVTQPDEGGSTVTVELPRQT